MALHFHTLPVKRITPEAAGAAAITFAVPPELRDDYAFAPGQFLTLRATVDGQDVRRSYSICSPRQRYDGTLEIDVGIKPVEGGLFSRWAVQHLKPGSTLEVLPPDGRFTPRVAGARHRAGFAAGSGITPILSIVATTLEADPLASFTLVYCNQKVGSIMFNEVLQDLKDRYPARLKMVHLLSRQPQELEVLNGRLDEAKATELLGGLVPAADIDEAFICGPEPMIEGVERALLAAGVARERIHAERFLTGGAGAPEKTPKPAANAEADVQLDVVLDGKTWHLGMNHDGRVLDAALDAGLDLPYSCKGGVCCTCRAKLVEGQVEMQKNFTLEPWEIEKGFVLTCQAKPLTQRVVVSYDER